MIATTTTGELVRRARLAQGMTQLQLARKTGIAQSCIADVERRGGSQKLVGRIAASLGVDAGSLIGIRGGTDPRAKPGPSDEEIALLLEAPNAVAQRVFAIEKARYTSRYGK